MKPGRRPDPEKTYQGKPCRRGHLGIRYRSCGACIDCAREAAARRREIAASAAIEAQRIASAQ